MTAVDDDPVLYDTGRLPLWVRLPCLVFGLFCLVLATDLVTERLMSKGFLLHGPRSTLHGIVPALLALLLLAWLFCHLWMGRKRIVFDRSGFIVIQDSGWLGIWRHRIPLGEVASILIHEGRLRGRRFWDVYILHPSGKKTWLTQENAKPNACVLAERIERLTGQPGAGSL